MKLYLAKGTISVAAAIVAEEAGLAYTPMVVDFAAGVQNQPEYLAINPKGRVPALEVPGGILTETGAILDYLADLAPSAGVVPQDPVQAGRMREVMYYLASTMHVNHAHKLRGHRWATQTASHEDMRAKVTENMADCCAYIERNAIKGPYVLGDQFCVADAYLYVVSTWLAGDGVTIFDYPKLAAHHAAMGERPSVKAVRAAGYL
ncbi:glutathione S-transferase family protein [Pseudorhodobacter aquimaris]|uniref:glutathione S-transferase family protein n=1 Tax=Pseudorhodobacter aquimaris TaxID=687412 RepID=UPI00067C18C8|nr:glutathione S-transferase family protein [Pseudorhodobacter aquimaris]